MKNYFNILLVFILSLGLFYACKDNKVNNNKVNQNSKDSLTETLTKDKINGYETIKIKDFGEILLPPNMEIQGGKYKKLNEGYYEKLGINYPDFVIQQKGLNEFDEDSKSTYARIVIATKQLGSMRIEGITETIEYSNTELNDLSKQTRQDIEKELRKMGAKLIDWFGISTQFINYTYFSTKLSYTRRIKNNPITYVESHIFANYSKLHRVTFSYRLNDENNWKTVFKIVIDNLVIYNDYLEKQIR